MLIFQKKEYEIYRLNTRRCACYVIKYRDNCVLIDTSMNFERKALLKSLERLTVNKIDAIFVTHIHSDHVANAEYLSGCFACPVYAAKEGIPGLRSGRCTMPKGTLLHSKVVYKLATSVRFYEFEKFMPCKDARTLEDDVVNQYLGSEAKILKTPGHSSDGISIIICDEIAIVGDVMVNMFKQIYPPFADEPNLLQSSWSRLLETNCNYFYPAHGNVVSRELLKASCQKLK